jgi:hypothetical protein
MINLLKNKGIYSIPFIIVLISLLYSCFIYLTTDLSAGWQSKLGIGFSIGTLIFYFIEKNKIAVYLLLGELLLALFGWVILLPVHYKVVMGLGALEITVHTFELLLLLVTLLCHKEYHNNLKQQFLKFWFSIPK